MACLNIEYCQAEDKQTKIMEVSVVSPSGSKGCIVELNYSALKNKYESITAI